MGVVFFVIFLVILLCIAFPTIGLSVFILYKYKEKKKKGKKPYNIGIIITKFFLIIGLIMLFIPIAKLVVFMLKIFKISILEVLLILFMKRVNNFSMLYLIVFRQIYSIDLMLVIRD